MLPSVVHTQRLPRAYAAASDSASSRSIVHSFLVNISVYSLSSDRRIINGLVVKQAVPRLLSAAILAPHVRRQIDERPDL